MENTDVFRVIADALALAPQGKVSAATTMKK
jgi:hypothetical protein